MTNLEQAKTFTRQHLQWLKDKTAPMRATWASFKAQHPRRALTLKIIGLTGAIGFLLLFSFVLMIYWGAFGKLPTYPALEAIQNNVASEVYAEGDVLLGKYYIENRVNADFEEISPNIINALVATEDARFFEHSGVDFRAWMRVFFRTILMRNESSGGGSTLSQQLAKNLYPRKHYKILSTPIAKVKETFIARRLERIYNKEELLNLYLNTIPFGEDIFGVKVASQRFFNTSPRNIKVEDAAVLVGMLKANTRYNPVKYPERSKTRRNTVLKQMVKYEYLDPTLYDSLSNRPIKSTYYKEGSNLGIATYFREHLRLELADILKDYKKPNGDAYNLYTDGLKIFTTIDAKLQQYAEESIKEQMLGLQKAFNKHWKGRKAYGSDKLLNQSKEKSKRYKELKAKGYTEEMIEESFNKKVKMSIFNWQEGGKMDTLMSPYDSLKYYLTILNAGFLVSHPQTGKILAWSGGVDHQYFKYDHVKSRRQVGSTFKPVVYARALQKGIPACDYIDNLQITYTQYDNWTPRNSDGEYGGVYSMEGALSKSINAATVDLMLRTGTDSVKWLAEKMGIEGEIPEVPSISLGTMDASLLEMVKVYSTFANKGKRPELHYLKRIETAEGDTLLNFEAPDPNQFQQILADSIAQMMTQMLRTVVDSGTAKRLRYKYGLYNQIAGKTGTTQNHSDGWFMGYTPNLVGGVWVGAESPQVRFRSMKLGQGSNTALPIWGRFLNKVYKDPEYKKWRRLKFPELDSLSQWEMDCPLYLEDRSLIPWLYEDDIDEGFFNWIRGLFKKEQELEELDAEQREEARYNRSRVRIPNKNSERIRKNNEKLEKKRSRKKKRKNFFDKFKKQ